MKTKNIGPLAWRGTAPLGDFMGNEAGYRIQSDAMIEDFSMGMETTEDEALAAGVARAKKMLPEDPCPLMGERASEPVARKIAESAPAQIILANDHDARAALARLVAAIHEQVDVKTHRAFIEAERALEEPERDWKAEARDDWSERALEDAR